MLRAALALMVAGGCTTGSDFDVGVYTEYFSPDRLVDQSMELVDVGALFEINTKVECDTDRPVAICVAERRQWCGASPCSPGSWVNAIMNFDDDDRPTGTLRLYISGTYSECAGVWITAIR